MTDDEAVLARETLLMILARDAYEDREEFRRTSGNHRGTPGDHGGASGDHPVVDCCRALLWPMTLVLAARVLTHEMHRSGWLVDGVAGVAIGALGITSAVSLTAVLPAVWIRKVSDAKSFGAEPGSRIVWPCAPRPKRLVRVEDVVTTGESALDATQELQTAGATVSGLFCLVLRGDRPKPTAQLTLHEKGVSLPVRPLFTLADVRHAHETRAFEALRAR